MRTLADLFVHPIKALDPLKLDATGISAAGGLVGDRQYALVDADGDYVNGKRTDAVHRIRATYDPALQSVALRAPGCEPAEFRFDDDREALAAWFTDYLGYEVSLEHRAGGELTDGAVYGDGSKTGPTLVSRATLETTASWFDGIDAEEMRRRVRANLVVEGVPAFWEDGLVGGESVLEIGDTRLAVTDPVPRCVVPTRDPETGEADDDFQRTFVEKREATFPEWAPEDTFDHFFTLTVGTRVLDADTESRVAVGDSVELVEE